MKGIRCSYECLHLFFKSKLASNQSLIDIGHDICICKIKGMNIDMNEHLGSVRHYFGKERYEDEKKRTLFEFRDE